MIFLLNSLVSGVYWSSCNNSVPDFVFKETVVFVGVPTGLVSRWFWDLVCEDWLSYFVCVSLFSMAFLVVAEMWCLGMLCMHTPFSDECKLGFSLLLVRLY